MGLEAATYIHQLNPANPVGPVDPKAQGDDHLRLIKSTIQATFPNITGAVTATHTQLNNAGGSGITGFAIPTNKIKGTGAAGAGVATTAMRSDAQIVQDLADTYVWTGQHSWSLQLLGHVNNTPATPAFSFAGDPNTGIYRSASDCLDFAAGGVQIGRFYSGGLQMLAANVVIYGQDGTAGAPGFSFQNDPDTGFYRIGSNTIGVAVNTANIARFIGNGTGELQLTNGNAPFPSYSFINDVDSGFYLDGVGQLAWAVNGVRTAAMDGNQLFIGNGAVGTPALSFLTDPNTGIYRMAADELGFVENGVGFRIGFREIPQNSQSGNYTLLATDNGKHILHPNGGGAGDVYTIPANASVAYPIGTVLTFVNRATDNVSIAITTDTLILAGSTTTGTRTLGVNGVATAIKVEAQVWIISGTGLS